MSSTTQRARLRQAEELRSELERHLATGLPPEATEPDSIER